MEYNVHTLSNGLRIIHLPSASSVVYCGYQINAGARDEVQGEEGLAHFCEHVSFKGTARRNALKVISTLESMGGELNAYTNKEDTVYYAAVMREHIARAVDILTDITFHSQYPQQEIDKEVEVICDEIESYNDSPAELVYDEFENIIFHGHPLGHSILGTAERVRTYTTDDARRFTGRFYKPENAVFFAYGNLDFAKLVRMLENATSDFPAAMPWFEGHDAVVLSEYVPRKTDLSHGTHQAHVMLGNRTFGVDDGRRMPLFLLNNILGGPAMSARLNLALRERNGLVYTVESSLVGYSDTGVWSVYFGCDPQDVAKCVHLVRRELDRMMSVPLSATRLAAVKRQIKGQIGIACDNRENFALDFGKEFLHYGWKKDVDLLFKRIDAVTSQQIQEVAVEVFDGDNMSMLTMM